MKRLSLCLFALAIILAACVPAPSPVPSIVITDALGRQVALPGLPERIVMAGKGLFMLVNAAYLFPEATERIAGLAEISHEGSRFISMIDPGFEEKSVLGESAGPEQIAALEPDLVLLKSYLASSTGAAIEELDIPVIYLDLESPEQYARDLAILGEVFGNETRAAEIAGYYQEKTDSIQQAVSPAGKPRTLMLYYDDAGSSVAFNVPPEGWIQTRLVELAGGEPVWTDANSGSGWAQVTLEQIASWDPDQVFIITYDNNSSEAVATLEADPNWQALRVIRENRIHAFPADFNSWDLPDTRWVLGLTWLAGKLHPDLFPGLDLVAEARSFYQQLYGIDPATFDQDILPLFKGDLP